MRLCCLLCCHPPTVTWLSHMHGDLCTHLFCMSCWANWIPLTEPVMVMRRSFEPGFWGSTVMSHDDWLLHRTGRNHMTGNHTGKRDHEITGQGEITWHTPVNQRGINPIVNAYCFTKTVKQFNYYSRRLSITQTYLICWRLLPFTPKMASVYWRKKNTVVSKIYTTVTSKMTTRDTRGLNYIFFAGAKFYSPN